MPGPFATASPRDSADPDSTPVLRVVGRPQDQLVCVTPIAAADPGQLGGGRYGFLLVEPGQTFPVLGVKD